MQGDLKWKHEPSWQDVINFANRVIRELKPLVEDDNQNIMLLIFMNKAISLKHHAIVEQQKELIALAQEAQP